MPRSERSAVAVSSLGLAEQQVGEGQRVDPHVEQRAGAERRVEHPVVGAGVDDEAELGVQVAGRAELTRAEPRAQLADHRVAGGPHRLHQEPVRARRASANSSSASAASQRDRLLAEHVLAGLEAEPGVLEVEGVRRGDVDDVDGRVGDQLLVGAVRRGATPCSAANAAALARAERRADRGELGAGHQREVAGEGAGDASGARGCPSGCRRVMTSPSPCVPARRGRE